MEDFFFSFLDGRISILERQTCRALVLFCFFLCVPVTSACRLVLSVLCLAWYRFAAFSRVAVACSPSELRIQT